MLLLLDAGNTRVKWAVVPHAAPGAAAAMKAGQWTASGSVAHADLAQLPDLWRSFDIDRVLASNVAGNAMRDAVEQCLFRTVGMQPVPVVWFASTAELGGIRSRYRNPAQLGCDRFASAIGAHALFPGEALIVATCGTATTVDAITEEGDFLGGMILPGLGLMASSLARNTAQLPEVAEHLDVAEPFADHTDAAIVSGCIAAQTGAIERALAAHERHHAPVKCVLSGGAAPLIAPHLNAPHTYVDKLVLIGLHYVALQSHLQRTSC